MARLCPVGTEVQTLIFPDAKFAPSQAKRWALSHGFKATKLDLTSGSTRIRQVAPSRFRPGSFRTIRLGDSGVSAVVGCPLKETTMAARKKRAKKRPSKKRGKKKRAAKKARKKTERRETLADINLKKRVRALTGGKRR